MAVKSVLKTLHLLRGVSLLGTSVVMISGVLECTSFCPAINPPPEINKSN